MSRVFGTILVVSGIFISAMIVYFLYIRGLIITKCPYCSRTVDLQNIEEKNTRYFIGSPYSKTMDTLDPISGTEIKCPYCKEWFVA